MGKGQHLTGKGQASDMQGIGKRQTKYRQGTGKETGKATGKGTGKGIGKRRARDEQKTDKGRQGNWQGTE
jgi:hypothetical protein